MSNISTVFSDNNFLFIPCFLKIIMAFCEKYFEYVSIRNYIYIKKKTRKKTLVATILTANVRRRWACCDMGHNCQWRGPCFKIFKSQWDRLDCSFKRQPYVLCSFMSLEGQLSAWIILELMINKLYICKLNNLKIIARQSRNLRM